ncbi:MAG: 5-(carboxyamino)imidazole ribonucleotide synthase [Planctomycetaceae bacterium]|nr:5-(carboxyamino)imidazole ribonucleotide synthase [Planctomycetaceae bacterium]
MILGILGGGQLGWMLGIAARRLGIDCVFLDPATSCTADLVGERIRADYDDPDALAELARRCDVVTYEFENVPATAAASLAKTIPVRPGWNSLETSQDRLVEKNFLAGENVPVPPFHAVDDVASLKAAISEIGTPAILKTRRGGYDGKGQVVLRDPAAAADAIDAIGGRPAILESMVDFDLEVSVLVVRGVDGTTKAWPPIRNHHAEGILRRSECPAPGVSPRAGTAMVDHAVRIAEALDHVGVLTVEFFVIGDTVLANEIAPRVHNSGHLTIEFSETDQFENHVLAVTGHPLGSTAARHGHAIMLNAIGDSPPPTTLADARVATVDAMGIVAADGNPDDDAVYHGYRKTSRVARKVGHLTITDDSIDPVRADALAAIVPGAIPD